jgi:hypothetical protein
VAFKNSSVVVYAIAAHSYERIYTKSPIVKFKYMVDAVDFMLILSTVMVLDIQLLPFLFGKTRGS